ncbi:hypothetical protein EVB41_079 [Rhizobium phage RHph_TM3_14A]|nr:hypothetical protein EVB29_080 [Rhizobium phage RHph_TM27A]QIG67000.1 hypothetical protein EVB30_080 [Rhizobium phage RHph_TM27B]QIG67088.1 hypothetical protein EVB31_078 [Rhizobium phage RHph_TM29]QIG67544.1 hypothetical protein EVB41_079 [Rhizobium phage RHph_TM3_14A]
MMSFLTRLFKSDEIPKPDIVTPDDSHMERRVKEAKWRNARAVHKFVEAAQKQENDANLARQVISDILTRAENKKAELNANDSTEK